MCVHCLAFPAILWRRIVEFNLLPKYGPWVLESGISPASGGHELYLIHRGGMQVGISLGVPPQTAKLVLN